MHPDQLYLCIGSQHIVGIEGRGGYNNVHAIVQAKNLQEAVEKFKDKFDFVPSEVKWIAHDLVK